MKIVHNRYSSRGSFTLQALFTTFGGMAFALLFLNLVRYVTANNALDQALRKTARCLTPTDGDCVSYTQTSSSSNLDWYGFRVSSGSPGSILSNRFDYRARMQQETWHANYNTYEIHRVMPIVGWTERLAARKVFQPRMNNFEARYAQVTRQVGVNISNSFLPRFEPNFPIFNQTYEDGGPSPRINRAESSWSPLPNRVRQYGPDGTLGSATAVFPFRPLAFGVTDRNGVRTNRVSAAIPSGEIITFESEEFEIPLINSATPECGAGVDCGVEGLVNASNAGPSQWATTAYLAIKAFSIVRDTNGDEIKWGTPSGDPDGLELRFSYNDPSTGGVRQRRIALGGRDYETVSESRHFHLVLRGPKDSNGKGSIQNARNAGNGVHEHIGVPRGSKIQIIARFTSRGSIDRVTPHVQIYYDDYIQTSIGNSPPLEGRCNDPVRLLPPDNLPAFCPPIANCEISLPQGVPSSDLGCKADLSTLTTTPLCDDDGLAFGVEHQASCASTNTISTITCDDKWKPADSLLTTLSTPAECSVAYCSWEEDKSKTRPVSVKDQYCTNLPLVNHSLECGQVATYSPTGEYGDVASCPNVISRLTDNASSETNNPQPIRPSNTELISSSDFRWKGHQELSPPLWTFSWIARDKDGAKLTGPDVIRALTPEPIPVVRFARKDRKAPAASTIKFPEEELGFGKPAEEFYSTVNLAKTATKIVEITKAYPYSYSAEKGGAYEIAYFGPTDPPNFTDYNLDCRVEDSCSAPFTPYSNLEEALRAYASSQVPEATDNQLEFLFDEPRYVQTDFFSSVDAFRLALSSQGVTSQCVPTNTLCSKPSKLAREYLGKFPLATFPNGPPECLPGGTYQDCHRELPAGETFADSTNSLAVDSQLARTKGFEEAKRLLPATHLEDSCDENSENCLSVSITALPDSQFAAVEVQYALPLTFPLKEILGKNSVLLTKTKQEMREMGAVGR